MARHRGSVVRVLAWNLFHGRDAPPEPRLGRLATRGRGRDVLGERYAQVRTSLLAAFAFTLAREPWDVALLQEAPPRWLAPLCRHTGAGGASALTARNLGLPLRARLAARRPDLLASWEGGSNQVLVRPPWRIAEVRRVTLCRRPERRRMVLVRLDGPQEPSLAVGCLHASVSGAHPERDVVRAAAAAVGFVPAGPLVLGGDLNLRPREDPRTFADLRERFDLSGATGPEAIDHLLARSVEVVEPARELPFSWREIERPDGLRVRLSDHAPVAAVFGVR